MTSPSDDSRELLALGLDRWNAGERASAVEYLQQAESILRTRIGEDARVAPDLAQVLTKLGFMRRATGNPLEAAADLRDAVGLNHLLLSATTVENSVEMGRRLIESLDHSADALDELGETSEAMELANEAISLLRALIGKGWEEFRPKLAGSLNSQAFRQSRPAQAQAMLEEAELLIREALIDDDSIENRTVLGVVLSARAGLHLRQLQIPELALDKAIDATSVWRSLSGESVVHRIYLARALAGEGEAYIISRSRRKATKSLRKSTAILRKMLSEDTTGRPEFKQALRQVVEVLDMAGMISEARELEAEAASRAIVL